MACSARLIHDLYNTSTIFLRRRRHNNFYSKQSTQWQQVPRSPWPSFLVSLFLSVIKMVLSARNIVFASTKYIMLWVVENMLSPRRGKRANGVKMKTRMSGRGCPMMMESSILIRLCEVDETAARRRPVYFQIRKLSAANLPIHQYLRFMASSTLSWR